MVENCNSNFFSGEGIAFQDLSQNDVQLHKMNCAFKYLSAKNVFILLQEFHKSWFSKVLNQNFAITHTISILIRIFGRFPKENLVSLVLRIILDLEFRIMRWWNKNCYFIWCQSYGLKILNLLNFFIVLNRFSYRRCSESVTDFRVSTKWWTSCDNFECDSYLAPSFQWKST